MALTLQERQAALNIYRFEENGVELFPRDAAALTTGQGIRLDYLTAQMAYLKGLRKTQDHLEKVLEDAKAHKQSRMGAPRRLA